jgi:hypothetical protein
MKFEEILSSLDEQAAGVLARQLLARLEEAEPESFSALRGGEGALVSRTGFETGGSAGVFQGPGAVRYGGAVPLTGVGRGELGLGALVNQSEAGFAGLINAGESGVNHAAVIEAGRSEGSRAAIIDAAEAAASGGRSRPEAGRGAVEPGGYTLRREIGQAVDAAARGGYYELFEARSENGAGAAALELTERLSESFRRDARRYDTPYDRY